MKLFASGPRPQLPKPPSLSDLADAILIAQQAYNKALAEIDADKQDAINKLTRKAEQIYDTEFVKRASALQGTPNPNDETTQMQADLEAISKP